MTVEELKQELARWAAQIAEAQHLANALRGLGDFVGAQRELRRAESLREAMRAIGALSQTH